MKTILSILIIFATCFSLTAQDATLTNSRTYVEYAGTAADTIIASGTLTKTIEVKVQEEHTIITQLFLDKISGTPDSCFVVTYGSLDGTNYVTVDTDTVVAGNADKTVDLAAKADVTYNFYKYIITKDGDTAKQKVFFRTKIWKK